MHESPRRGNVQSTQDGDELDARRHARLLLRDPRPRRVVMLEALNELVRARMSDRERQHEKRLDRERVQKRRTHDVSEMTARELDEHRVAVHGRAAQRAANNLIAAGLIHPDSADATAARILENAEPEVSSGRVWTDPLMNLRLRQRAWNVAIQLVELTPHDWQRGCYVLTEAATARLFTLWTRAELMIRLSIGKRAGNVDGWWIASHRSDLADHEIGIVLEAADRVPSAAPDLAASRSSSFESLLTSALDSVLAHENTTNGRSRDEFARTVAKRWQRLRQDGWEDFTAVVKKKNRAKR